MLLMAEPVLFYATLQKGVTVSEVANDSTKLMRLISWEAEH